MDLPQDYGFTKAVTITPDVDSPNVRYKYSHDSYPPSPDKTLTKEQIQEIEDLGTITDNESLSSQTSSEEGKEKSRGKKGRRGSSHKGYDFSFKSMRSSGRGGSRVSKKEGPKKKQSATLSPGLRYER